MLLRSDGNKKIRPLIITIQYQKEVNMFTIDFKIGGLTSLPLF